MGFLVEVIINAVVGVFNVIVGIGEFFFGTWIGWLIILTLGAIFEDGDSGYDSNYSATTSCRRETKSKSNVWKKDDYVDSSGAWRKSGDDYIDSSGAWRK